MAAIYQWFPSGDWIILTTTLYPVEFSDSLNFSVDITGGELRPIPGDEYNQTSDLLGAELLTILLSHGPDDIPYDQSGTVLAADLIH